jgi:pilus assembly protein CpaB
MSMRTIATLAVALFLGLVAVVLVRTYLSNATGPAALQPAAGSTVPIVVAARPLARGVMIEPDFLKVVNYPQDGAPTQAFHSIAEVSGGAGQQRLALRDMVENEPVLSPNVSGPGGKLTLSGTVTAGMRAIGVRINDVTGVGGFVLPGDRVDVLLTRGFGHDDSITQILAENVRVLGVDQLDNEQADKPVVAKAVTLEVTPEQAQSLSLGQTVGAVTLSLRKVADDAPLTQKSMTVSDLNPAPRKKAVAAVSAEPAIRVVRGVDTSRFSFGVSNALQNAATKTSAGTIAP